MHTSTNSATNSGAANAALVISASGLRRTSPESVRSHKLALAYREEGAPRLSRLVALRLAKRAATALGFNATALALLDQLFAASKPQDWTGVGGLGPCVWPSTAHLARKTNQSPKSVSRHLDRFCRAGLISWNDGPTCRRHGRRDGNGRIVEAFGIDLSPIAMRHDELLAIADAAEAEAKQADRLGKRRTVLRKQIKSLIASALERSGDDPVSSQPWQHGWARLDTIMERRPGDMEGLAEQVADLEAHHEHLEALFDGHFGQDCPVPDIMPDLDKMSHRGGQNGGDITITAPTSISDICSQNGIALSGDTPFNEAACGSMALEKKPVAKSRQNKQSPVETATLNDLSDGQSAVAPVSLTDTPAHGDNQPGSPGGNAAPDGLADPVTAIPASGAASSVARGENADGSGKAPGDDVLQLSIGLLRAACPAIEAIAPGALQHWQTLRDSGHALCTGADINRQVFDEASNMLGPDIAIAAIAVTVQKAAMGTVFKPGAYLRTLTKRGKAGELNIAKSLHGLAEHNANTRADNRNEDPMDDQTTHTTSGDETVSSAQADDGNPQTRPTGPSGNEASPAGDPPEASDSKAASPVDGKDDAPGTPPVAAFPLSGTIAYSPWADIVRNNAPKPVPDVDRVADAFRAFCQRHAIDTTSPNIETVFTTFCTKWTERL